jgi:cytochrome d ubiquinol oxidase subunit I
MNDTIDWHRFQFAFTIIYHYLFPQLTMGLAFLIVVMKTLGLRKNDPRYDDAARFWIKIFGVNFAVGVVTGIPMEFQFGTNWAAFTRYSSSVIGQTLAMEGMFAFFLESSFLAMLIWGEKKLGPRKHFLAAVALWIGSWLSGYFIVTTNAFMQHPVAYRVAENNTLELESLSGFLLNPWAMAQYAHTMVASLVTASFVVCAVSAYWLLRSSFSSSDEGKENPALLHLKVGMTSGLIASMLVAFPTGDIQAKLVAKYQPVTLAAMEGRFEGGEAAELNVIGQPNIKEQRLDNPISLPSVLSFLAYGTLTGYVKGLKEFPPEVWPTNIELLYYSFHVMVGLGTLFILLMLLTNFLYYTKRLARQRWLLWILLLSFPFPYIANTAGWMTAELGRQPWLIYGIMRTKDGVSPMVSGGDTAFTLLGFMGLYAVVSILYAFLIGREIYHGPEHHHGGAHA